MPLFSPEAFGILSAEWVKIGWALAYYYTFSWGGRPILQLPDDLVRLQEVVTSLRPDVIVETGVHRGGSLLFHATLCEALGNGRVIGVDRHLDAETRTALTTHRLSHRISLIEADSASAAATGAVRDLIRSGETVMVILDSDHSYAHVTRELEAYAPLVSTGSCIIATDGIMRHLGDVPGAKQSWAEDNPATAAQHFVAAHPEFEMRPPTRRVNGGGAVGENITYWPDGWLWKRDATA